jgi:TolA-binding protein
VRNDFGRPQDPRDPNVPNDPSPARLAIVGATDLERRLLAAAAAERPSPELQRRMRGALGLAAAGTTLATAAVVKAGASASAGASSWLAAGAFAAVVAGGVVASLLTTRAPEVTAVAGNKTPSAVAGAVAPAPSEPEPIVAPPARSVAPARHRGGAGDLRGEIALVDAARSAIRAGTPDRALSLLDHYRHSYPRGEFAPEAAVLRIEAAAAAGRGPEARRLARAFLAQHPDSPLADRVAHFADVP